MPLLKYVVSAPRAYFLLMEVLQVSPEWRFRRSYEKGVKILNLLDMSAEEATENLKGAGKIGTLETAESEFRNCEQLDGHGWVLDGVVSTWQSGKWMKPALDDLKIHVEPGSKKIECRHTKVAYPIENTINASKL